MQAFKAPYKSHGLRHNGLNARQIIIKGRTQILKILATLAAAASLAACVSPTSYRPAGAEGNIFGYTSSKLSDQVYRVRFQGSGRTPYRWIDAFLLYRSAEVAKDAGAPAFKIIEGKVDASTVLSGEDIFGGVDPDAKLTVVAMSRRPEPEGDVVLGSADGEANMRRTAGAMPVFRMPRPPLPKAPAPAPIYIYTPGYATPALPDRSILIELRADLQDKGDNIFETAEVLQKLAPRIKRAVPTTQATPSATTPTPL
ncbi:CC0125/CC1285 family lipoprotein [Variovorax boronicumulans]|uniref:CC0125/CC1285 family lipoprotein n=1 Tax=Variovorax boronicumulans TaxID=436515 RepID=UPI003393E2C5